MYIETSQKNHVKIIMNKHKAQRLLDSLIKNQKLGDPAKQLAAEMEKIGIGLSSDPEHIRYEYSPPLDNQ